LKSVSRLRQRGQFYAEIIDKLRAEGAVRPAAVGNSSLVHTAWALGSALNTVVTYFQIVGAEIRVIDCDHDLDLTPVQRVSRMLAKGYLYGSHFLPHDAMATMKVGKPS
jgi:phage terminase large subunit